MMANTLLTEHATRANHFFFFLENIRSFHKALHSQVQTISQCTPAARCDAAFVCFIQCVLVPVRSSLLHIDKTVGSTFNSRGELHAYCLFKPTQVRHIVGSYLHILRLLCDFAKRINHRKAPQSANINELQPRHTPAPVTNCLAVCTGLCISQSSFLTRFDHSDGRLWHLCRHYSEIHGWNLELFFFSFFYTAE